MTDFTEDVYKIVKTIPKGKVASYGWVGKQLGSARLARAVGNALHKNPFADIPCHRVVNSQGKLAEKFGKGGWRVQKEMLVAEGVRFANEHRVDQRWMVV